MAIPNGFPQKFTTLDMLLKNLPCNETIGNNYIKAWSFINSPKYKSIICSISGGSDSDIMLDICYRCDIHNKIKYIWFDTGLEYQATKDHIKYLEMKYGIEIIKYKAKIPIPKSCRDYGVPFLSKQISDFIERLQKHNFEFEDLPMNELLEKYCKWDDKKQDYVGCKSAIAWWCNANGDNSNFNINKAKGLKEFIIRNKPPKISSKCCKYAKKDLGHKALKDYDADLNIIGVRRAEGGLRSTMYHNCFDDNYGEYDNYRPLFWYTDEDKKVYENHFGVTHSACYYMYGLKRTGCVGCPYNSRFEEELEIVRKYEPKLYKAINNIFGKSYEYLREYRKFKNNYKG